MTRAQHIDQAEKYAIRKFGYAHSWLWAADRTGFIPPTFHKSVLTAWDKINLKESV